MAIGMADLPIELLHLIFRYVEDQRDKLPIFYVCKGFARA